MSLPTILTGLWKFHIILIASSFVQILHHSNSWFRILKNFPFLDAVAKKKRESAVSTSILGRMRLDNGNIVLKELFLVLLVGILLPISNKWFITWRKSMVHQLASNQKFDRRAKKSYYSLQQHRRKEHGAKQRRASVTVADLNKIVEEEGEDGETLKDKLSMCQRFLVNTEMENGRHKVFNIQRYLTFKLNTKIINEELEEVFNKLDSAAKSNFRGVAIDDLPLVEGIVECNVFIYNFDI